MKDVLVKPVITEKSMSEASRGWYTFIVAKKSSKGEIANAVKQEFKVHVKEVRTLVIKGEMVRSGKKRLLRKTSTFKKAFVKLSKNEKIGLFETEAPQIK